MHFGACFIFWEGGGGGVNVTVRCAAVRACFVKNRTVRLGTGLRRLTGQMSNIAIIAREFFLQHDDAGEENRRQCARGNHNVPHCIFERFRVSVRRIPWYIN